MICQAQVNDSKGPVGGDVTNVLYSCSLFWVSCTFPVYRALFPMAFISLGRIRVSPCWRSWTFSLRRGLVTWGVVGIGTLTYWYWLTGCNYWMNSHMLYILTVFYPCIYTFYVSTICDEDSCCLPVSKSVGDGQSTTHRL